MNSTEACTFVNNLYHYYLGRDADQSGLDFYSGGILTGVSANDVEHDIQTSSEAATYTQTLDRALDDIYQLELGRHADPTGLAYWEHDLRTGISMADVDNSIVNSAEGNAYRDSNTIKVPSNVVSIFPSLYQAYHQGNFASVYPGRSFQEIVDIISGQMMASSNIGMPDSTLDAWAQSQAVYSYSGPMLTQGVIARDQQGFDANGVLADGTTKTDYIKTKLVAMTGLSELNGVGDTYSLLNELAPHVQDAQSRTNLNEFLTTVNAGWAVDFDTGQVIQSAKVTLQQHSTFVAMPAIALPTPKSIAISVQGNPVSKNVPQSEMDRLSAAIGTRPINTIGTPSIAKGFITITRTAGKVELTGMVYVYSDDPQFAAEYARDAQAFWGSRSFTDTDGTVYKTNFSVAVTNDKSRASVQIYKNLAPGSQVQTDFNTGIQRYPTGPIYGTPALVNAHEFAHVALGALDAYAYSVWSDVLQKNVYAVPYQGYSDSILANTVNGQFRGTDLKAILNHMEYVQHGNGR